MPRDPRTGEPRERPEPFQFQGGPATVTEIAPEPELPPNPEASKPRGETARNFANLGANKKARGGPRKLTKDDTDKLENYYNLFGMGMMAVRPRVSNAIFEKIDDDRTRARGCAESVCELAAENDSVRRTVLWLVEGGAWANVAAMHLPLVVAAIPEDVIAGWLRPFVPPQQEENAA